MLPDNNNTQQTAPAAPKAQQGASIMQVMHDMLVAIVSRWWWYVIAIALAIVACKMYLLITPNIYTRNASIMLKNDKGGVKQAAGFDLEMISSAIDINNEIFALTSPDLMEDVVRRLKLQVNYYSQGRFHEECVYGSLPGVEVMFLEQEDNDPRCECRMDVNTDSTYRLSEFKRNGAELKCDPIKGKLGDVVQTPLGAMLVKSKGYAGIKIPVRVERLPLRQTVNQCLSRFSVHAKDKKSTILMLTYNDLHPDRASDVLTTAIGIYNENWVIDHNRMAISTSEFIGQRLIVLEKELTDVERDISTFKASNLIPASANDVASQYLGQKAAATARIDELNVEIYLTNYVRSYLVGNADSYQLIPAMQTKGANLGSEISAYNELLLRRNNLLQASSPKNPLVIAAEDELTQMRRLMIANLDNYLGQLQTELKSEQKRQQTSDDKIASSPEQSRYLLTVERQQKVKENLYLYLLQKREENELSQAFTAYNSRVISSASGSNKPTSPVPSTIWMLGILLALTLPTLLIVAIEQLNFTVRGRNDLNSLTIPFVGEIPMAQSRDKVKQKHSALTDIKNKLKNIEKENKDLHILVKADSRNQMNEAFRVLRTNLEFMSANGQRDKVLMFTSFSPNSGKTFLVTNLATSLALRKRSVLVMDLDLRKASLSAWVKKPKPGISDYLGGIVDDVAAITYKVEGAEGVDLMPVGTVPPNPTELLSEPRLAELIQQMRERYDYIFLDCPPTEVVADASIVATVADMTMFVVRAEYFSKSLLPDLQRYYDEHRLPKMSVVLNGTEDAFSRYGYHKYGTRYGYSYGYGYGYGYRKKGYYYGD